VLSAAKWCAKLGDDPHTTRLARSIYLFTLCVCVWTKGLYIGTHLPTPLRYTHLDEWGRLIDHTYISLLYENIVLLLPPSAAPAPLTTDTSALLCTRGGHIAEHLLIYAAYKFCILKALLLLWPSFLEKWNGLMTSPFYLCDPFSYFESSDRFLRICGNKMPTRCNKVFYCRSYCLLNMFWVPLCPSSGAIEYYTVVAACGISCCGFEVAGLVWSW